MKGKTSLGGRIAYTVFTLALAGTLIAGIMAGMRALLQARVDRLLGQSGVLEVPAPVREWQTEAEARKARETVQEPEPLLTLSQMEDAVRYWETAPAEILHDPVEGQLSMEEAIEAGRSWLERMGLLADVWEEEKLLTIAMLSVGEPPEENGRMPEPYYSFWTLRIYASGWEATLALNAVTGDVWGGNVTLYNTRAEWDVKNILKSFAGEAGLEIDWERAVWMVQQDDASGQLPGPVTFGQLSAPVPGCSLEVMVAADRAYASTVVYDEKGERRSPAAAQAAVGEAAPTSYETVIFCLSVTEKD